MKESTYYVKFKNACGVVQKEYINARNCSAAVEKAKEKYGAKKILKSGKSINEKGRFGLWSDFML